MSLAIVAVGVAGQTAHAQSDTSSIALEEIIVTAEHRTSDVQKTAASLAVRNGQALQAEGKSSLQQMLEDIPGASSVSSLNGDAAGLGITIRGVAANNDTTAISPVATTAVYTDGVYEGIGGAYDIDRIELLRGPQGTLYGRSATAGVVATHTRNPSFEAFGADVSAELGNYSLRHYTGAVNVPFTETLALRVSADDNKRDGYYGGGGAVDQLSTRIKLLYKPNEYLSVLVGAASQDNKTYSGGTTGTITSPGNFTYTAARCPVITLSMTT